MQISLVTPDEMAVSFAQKLRRIRKRRKITQKDLAKQSGVSYASVVKFEQTGQISLVSFIKIAMSLDCTSELEDLFTRPVYLDITEVINDAK